MGIQGRVYVSFIINKDGTIGSVRMRGPEEMCFGFWELCVTILWRTVAKILC
jgi:hypothetical protein